MPSAAASTVHDAAILNRSLWTSPLQRAVLSRHEQKPPKRVLMNPNRLVAGLLSAFEGPFFRSQLHFELKQSEFGVLNLDKETAETVLTLIFSRIVTVASPGSTLSIAWKHQRDRLCLQLSLSPAAIRRPGSAPLTLFPQNSPLRQRLGEAGIRYESNTSNGPWELSFDTLYI